jgi:hypothetical protein
MSPTTILVAVSALLLTLTVVTLAVSFLRMHKRVTWQLSTPAVAAIS